MTATTTCSDDSNHTQETVGRCLIQPYPIVFYMLFILCTNGQYLKKLGNAHCRIGTTDSHLRNLGWNMRTQRIFRSRAGSITAKGKIDRFWAIRCNTEAFTGLQILVAYRHYSNRWSQPYDKDIHNMENRTSTIEVAIKIIDH